LKTVVITTYDRERYLLEVNLRSIAKYLEPCKVIYIYCDKSNKYDEWVEWFDTYLRPLAPTHHIETYDSNYFYDSSLVREQLHFAWALKIFVSQVVDEPFYWSIDSKNFFFKPTTFEQLKEIYPVDCSDFAEDLVKKYQSMYSIPNTVYKINSHPFKFTTEICKEMVDRGLDFNDNHYDDCFSFQAYCYYKGIEVSPGECDFNSSLYGHKEWESSPDPRFIVNYMKVKSNDSIRVTGIHRVVCEKYLNKDSFNSIIFHVGGKDLIPTSTPWTFN
jgi:hypothetical protein